MPVLNGAATVRAAVDSVLGQTLTDLELIVIDDGSTDDTPAVLAGIHDERLRISTNAECRGLTPSLILGVEMATSGLIARMDADDVASPDRLALEYGLFRAYPQVGLVATAYSVVDVDGNDVGYVGVPPDHASVALWLRFGCCLAHPTVMFRRDVYRLVGGYREDEFPADDYGLWLRMVEVTQVATVASAQLRYRQLSTGVSAVYRTGMRDMALELAAGAIERLTGERPAPEIVSGLTGLGPPIGCDRCDEALSIALRVYTSIRRESRARQAPRAELHRQLPRLALRCGLRDPDGSWCRACVARLVARHPLVAARLAGGRLRAAARQQH